MCYPVKCPKCGKTTWAGCGLHKEMVMAKIPPEERCTCPERAVEGYPAAAPPPPADNTPEPSSNEIPHLHTTEELKTKLADAGSQLVVVDFYGASCAPCRVMAAHVARWSKKYAGRALFYKIDGEKDTQVVEESNVAGFPTIVLYKSGNACETFPGVDFRAVEAAIERNL